MKTKLLFLLFLLVTLAGYSQTDIEQLQSASGSQYLQMTGTIDQSATGNVSWDFTSSLTPSSNLLLDTYSNTPPTSIIQTSSGGTPVSTIGLNTSGGVVSVTSASSSGIQLNYSDFAAIGMFPLSFGYSNIDGLEGTFTGPTSGDILNTSTINVNVDAWGNLKVGTFDGSVTRLKIIQNLNLSALGGLVTSTATQTSYFYYDASSNDLVFRFTRLQVPLASIDDTLMESLSTYTLGNNKLQIAASDIQLISNPVKEMLMFRASNAIEIKSITISDLSGRIVLKSNTNNDSLDVSVLNSGLFLATVTTNKGLVTKKFVKL